MCGRISIAVLFLLFSTIADAEEIACNIVPTKLSSHRWRVAVSHNYPDDFYSVLAVNGVVHTLDFQKNSSSSTQTVVEVDVWFAAADDVVFSHLPINNFGRIGGEVTRMRTNKQEALDSVVNYYGEQLFPWAYDSTPLFMYNPAMRRNSQVYFPLHRSDAAFQPFSGHISTCRGAFIENYSYPSEKVCASLFAIVEQEDASRKSERCGVDADCSKDTNSSSPPPSSSPSSFAREMIDYCCGEMQRKRRTNGGWTELPAAGVHNPQEPGRVFPHHPAFQAFEHWYGPIEDDYVVDWLGIRIDARFDCVRGEQRKYAYAEVVPSYIMMCKAHLHQREQKKHFHFVPGAGPFYMSPTLLVVGRHGNKDTGAPPHLPVAKGIFPVVDEEYFQWVDCLTSAREAAESYHADDPDYRYTVIELGARYGTWTVRGIAAYRQLVPGGKVLGVALENDPEFCEWSRRHANDNGLGPDEFQVVCETANSSLLMDILLSGDVAAANNNNNNNNSNDDDDDQHSSSNTTATTRAWQGLPEGQIVDLLDVDIQYHEMGLFVGEDDRFHVWSVLTERVRRIHVGTHNRWAEVNIAATARQFGWEVVAEFPNTIPIATKICDPSSIGGVTWEPQCLQQTSHGNVYFRDGILSLVNPRLTRGN